MDPVVITALATIIICTALGIAPIIVIAVLIYKVKKANDARSAELIEKGMELHKMKAEAENPSGINPKRIVRCEFCRSQTRFGDGKCKYCGANLKYENAISAGF